MVGEKEQFSALVAAEALAAFRTVAKAKDREFEAALEDVMLDYVAAWKRSHPGVRPEVLGHYRDSLGRNRKLYELLAQAEQRK